MKRMEGIPLLDGFRLLPEDAWHSGCWLLWPQRQDNWRMGGKYAQQVVAQIANTISRFEPVWVCVNQNQYENACSRLDAGVRVIEMSSNEAFMRDVGPTFISNGSEIRGVDWTFNGYGGMLEGLYFPWDQDNLIARKVCELSGLCSYPLREFVFEGCAFRTDGEGTLAVTEECLLSIGRNPSLSKQSMESTLKSYLGVSKIIWLKRGLFMDEGKGHIDNLLCFMRPGEVLLSWTDEPKHPQYEIVREALDTLEHETDAAGRHLKIRKIPLPSPIVISEEEACGIDCTEGALPRRAGDVLVASYLNFYMPNGALVYPLFHSETDTQAERVLQECFPNRKAVGIYARELFLGGGGIHSMVLGQPAPSAECFFAADRL